MYVFNIYILHILFNFIYFIRHAGLQKKKGGKKVLYNYFPSWSWRTTLLRIYILIMHHNRGKCHSQITTSQWQLLPQDTKRKRTDRSHLGVLCLLSDGWLWRFSLSLPGSCCRFSLAPGHSRSTRLRYVQPPAASALSSEGCCTKTDKCKVSINVHKHDMKTQF